MPLVVSWGYEAEHPGKSQFIDYHEWQGTRDFASYLSTPAAIDFQEEHHWPEVRRECHQLGVETRERIHALSGVSPICGEEWFGQFFVASLPASVDPSALHQHLYVERNIVAPYTQSNDLKFIRVSFQAYNTQEDADKLVEALRQFLNHN
jgi:isopenicillin-N epimerase